jgi:hypothetical protein
MKKVSLLLLFIFFFQVSTEAQILKRIVNQTARSAQRKIEQKVAERLAEEIAKQAFKSIDRTMDDVFYDAFGPDTLGQRNDSLYYQYGRNMGEIMKGMNDAVDLPPSYEFDLQITSKVENAKGKETNEMTMLYSSNGSAFGIRENSNQGTIMLFDIENNSMVVYQNKNGKKVAQTLPSFWAWSGNTVDEKSMLKNIRTTGKSKKMAGYKCQEYIGETEKYKMNFYATEALGVNWKQQYGKLMDKMVAYKYSEEMETIKGIVLGSTMVNKENSKDKITTEAINISKKTYTITNSEYEFGGIEYKQ